ncbi:MAG: hypothetical protein AAF581_17735 [Planctomycetota bacterium]
MTKTGFLTALVLCLGIVIVVVATRDDEPPPPEPQTSQTDAEPLSEGAHEAVEPGATATGAAPDTGEAKSSVISDSTLQQLLARLQQQDETIAELRASLAQNQERLVTLEANVDIFEPYQFSASEYDEALNTLGLDFEADQKPGTLPEGWGRCGPKGPHEVVADDQHSYTGRWSTRMSNSDEDAPGFGGVMGKFPHKFIAGKRIRYSGYVRTEDVKGGAALWFRADGGSGAFNNMMMNKDDIVDGTNEWTQFSFDLDIPKETHNVNFGAFLKGSGTMWVDDLDVQILGDIDEQ